MGPGHRGLHFTLLPLRDHGDKRKIKNNLDFFLKTNLHLTPYLDTSAPRAWKIFG